MSFSADSRILIFSSTLQQAFDFINCITPSPQSSLDANIIHWTIANKYYTAQVHFQVHIVQEWRPYQGVPAVVFVWSQGEPYRDHILHLSRELERHRHVPEVSLAVRKMAVRTSAEAGYEDEDDIDEFLSSHGFEFVDALEHPAVGSDATPSFRRVVDALSTIMWPSMVQSQPASRKNHATDLELADWTGDDSFDSSLAPEDNRIPENEMDKLQRWLEEDIKLGRPENTNEDPWVTDGTVFSSPTAHISPLSGFDDDFTAFVSAPALSSVSDHAWEEPSFDDEKLMPMNTASTYSPLGSVSDFGTADDDETEAISARTSGPTSPTSDGLESPLATFDLTRVLSELEGVKAEIAGMSDDAERRKAAAKITLELVYGKSGEEN